MLPGISHAKSGETAQLQRSETKDTDFVNIVACLIKCYGNITREEKAAIRIEQEKIAKAERRHTMLAVGTKAPDFSLPDQNGELHSLKDYRGKKLILYFYPKDNTSGCTKQACGFGELYPQFLEKGAVVVGVSRDSVKSHKNFETKYDLPFTLLSDPDLGVLKAYDVWKEKTTCGRTSMGTVRTTYLIDEDGVIIQANDRVKAAGNPQEMLTAL